MEKRLSLEPASDITRSELRFSRPDDGTLLVHLAGNWKLAKTLPSADNVRKEMESAAGVKQLRFDTQQLMAWESGLLTFLIQVIDLCQQKGIQTDRDGLPEGANKLIDLATAVPERAGARKETARVPVLARIGDRAIKLWSGILDTLSFLGEVFTALLRMFIGKSRFRWSELWLTVQEVSVEALPIVSLINFLVGLILAFMGSIQLQMFGAQIYVADLVAIATVRAMGAIMTGIIMSGRTGASFAARIGTMQVNEEIDALKTTGISPMDFLVLPRMLALCIMMPLLTLYANLMGILGGLVVGVAMLDLGVYEYYHETAGAVSLKSLFVGLFMSLVFGVLIALAGCLRGIQCGRSASAVGQATTSAVVTSIVSIIVATAIIMVACQILGV
jgi:phospholipid/cholesterol/gamma-HCH transport system permease protein